MRHVARGTGYMAGGRGDGSLELHQVVGKSEDIELDEVSEGADEELARLTTGPRDREGFETEKGSAGLPSDLTGEYGNIAVLMVLYTLQGMPMGVAAVMPLLLKQRGASFSDLGTFSLNAWPFSLKLLWAPIVDALYIRSFGRRKTWIIPAQLLIGSVLLLLSSEIERWLNDEKPNVVMLTASFFLLHLLCATQDIAVDGWAITMLRLENVGYASTCNSAGQTLGYFVCFTGFMVLEHYKLVSLSGFVGFWGVLFIVCTIAVAIVKMEDVCRPDEEPPSIADAYKQMLSMVKSIPIQHLSLMLITWKVPFAPADACAGLKVQEYGVPKEYMAYLATLVMPVQICMPLVVARRISGPAPLDVALSVYPWRSCLTFVAALVVYNTPTTLDPAPWGFYGLLFCLTVVQSMCSSALFASTMGFFARVSKSTPEITGTYMTVLNTISNLGGMWTITLTYYAIDLISCKGDTCTWERDGYYLMSVLCATFGIVWLWAAKSHVRRLQLRSLEDWNV